MPDIATITINPAIDIFVNVDHVEPTRKMRVSAPRRDPGGGGINVARVAHRLGSTVAAIYPTGGAIGKLLQRLVEREGITSLVTPSHVEPRENFTAFEEDSGEQFRFVLLGARLPDQSHRRRPWAPRVAHRDRNSLAAAARSRQAPCPGPPSVRQHRT